MATPYIGELRLVSFNFAPTGWAPANGQVVAINSNPALFAAIGTIYGGDGRVNFALPNLQGRVAIHFGNGFAQGQASGEAQHVLTVPEMPAHTHIANANNAAANSTSPVNNFFANTTGGLAIYSNANPTPLSPTVVSTTGANAAHENRQPFLVMNWIIALTGIFPSKN